MFLYCPVFEKERCLMFSKVEEIMKKAGKSIQGKRWHVSYPGQLSFHPDPKYLSKFPILSEMRWFAV